MRHRRGQGIGSRSNTDIDSLKYLVSAGASTIKTNDLRLPQPKLG